MIAWLCLTGSIVFEVFGTICLRLAVDSRRWHLGVVTGYLTAFTLLAVTLAHGMPLGMAYGIWSAAGVALTAVLSRFLFREPLTWLMGLGIVLIVGGVLLIKTGRAY